MRELFYYDIKLTLFQMNKSNPDLNGLIIEEEKLRLKNSLKKLSIL